MKNVPNIREGKKLEFGVWKYMEECNLCDILWSIIQKVKSVEKNLREETREGTLIVSCMKKFYRGVGMF